MRKLILLLAFFAFPPQSPAPLYVPASSGGVTPNACSANTYATALADAAGTLTCGAVADAGLAVSYLKADGSRGLSGNWNAGSFDITASHFIGALTGNADTCTAFAANPSACASGFVTDQDANGTLTCSTNGSALTSLNATNLSSGTVDSARLPTVPISKGGTNSTTALNNNRVMVSSSDKIVEASAITASRALVSDSNGIPTHSTTSTTELQYLTGAIGPFLSVGALWGSGEDGSLSISAGTTTLTGNWYGTDLTISGTGSLNPNGWAVYGTGTLDISAAPANAINWPAGNGGNGSTTTGGTAAAASSAQYLSFGTRGGAGGNGGTAAGSNGTAATLPTAGFVAQAGGGGVSRTGGAGSGGAGGTSAAQRSPSNYIRSRSFPLDLITATGATPIQCGTGGAGGGGGGGDGALAGGGAGAGGNGGNCLKIAFRVVNRSGATAANAVSVNGGSAGTGANAPAGAGRGGGQGGNGGAGGFLWFLYGLLTGSQCTGCLSASGGPGGNGGLGNSTGVGGDGGSNGGGGEIAAINAATGAVAATVGSGPTLGGLHSGTTGGTGASINTTQANL